MIKEHFNALYTLRTFERKKIKQSPFKKNRQYIKVNKNALGKDKKY